MKKYIYLLVMAIVMVTFHSCEIKDEDIPEDILYKFIKERNGEDPESGTERPEGNSNFYTVNSHCSISYDDFIVFEDNAAITVKLYGESAYYRYYLSNKELDEASVLFHLSQCENCKLDDTPFISVTYNSSSKPFLYIVALDESGYRSGIYSTQLNYEKYVTSEKNQTTYEAKVENFSYNNGKCSWTVYQPYRDFTLKYYAGEEYSKVKSWTDSAILMDTELNGKTYRDYSNPISFSVSASNIIIATSVTVNNLYPRVYSIYRHEP